MRKLLETAKEGDRGLWLVLLLNPATLTTKSLNCSG